MCNTKPKEETVLGLSLLNFFGDENDNIYNVEENSCENVEHANSLLT